MPKEKPLFYDHRSMLKERVGVAGVRSIDLVRLSKRLEKAQAKLKLAAADGSVGWLTVPERRADCREVKSLARKMSAGLKTLVVIGIGGSDLGAKTLVRALKPASRGLDVRFVGSNTDPEEIADLLRLEDGTRCAEAAAIAEHKLADVRACLSDLWRMERVLAKLLGECHHNGRNVSCPLIASLRGR